MHVADKQILRHIAHIRLYALLHFTGGAVCECHTQHFIEIGMGRGMKHSPGEDMSFATSGPGEHQSSGVAQFDNLLLLRVVV